LTQGLYKSEVSRRDCPRACFDKTTSYGGRTVLSHMRYFLFSKLSGFNFAFLVCTYLVDDTHLAVLRAFQKIRFTSDICQRMYCYIYVYSDAYERFHVDNISTLAYFIQRKYWPADAISEQICYHFNQLLNDVTLHFVVSLSAPRDDA
jgi:hypothetical protein